MISFSFSGMFKVTWNIISHKSQADTIVSHILFHTFSSATLNNLEWSSEHFLIALIILLIIQNMFNKIVFYKNNYASLVSQFKYIA